MMTLFFGRMIVHKEKINERKKIIYFVEWSCANERNISMKTLIFGRMDVHYRKNKINERAPYNLVKWLCANKKTNQFETLIFGRMVMH